MLAACFLLAQPVLLNQLARSAEFGPV